MIGNMTNYKKIETQRKKHTVTTTAHMYIRTSTVDDMVYAEVHV